MSMTFADHLTEHQRHTGYIGGWGAVKSLRDLGAITAPGLCTQNFEIQNKKPNPPKRRKSFFRKSVRQRRHRPRCP
jgi:hypothetical protein